MELHWFIHELELELELENDRGPVETLSLFFIACFYCFITITKNPAKCKYLLFTFYSIVSEIVFKRNCFIHELELENDRGAIEMSCLFFIASFYNNDEKPRKM